MVLQPGGDLRRRAAVQQIEGTVTLYVYEDRAEFAAPPDGALIDAEDGSAGHRRFGQRMDHVEERVAARGESQVPTEPLPRSAAQREPDRLQHPGEVLGAPTIALDDLRHVLGEGAAWATPLQTTKAADLEVQRDGLTGHRVIRDVTGVTTMDAARAAMTTGTDGRHAAVAEFDMHVAVHGEHALHMQRRQVGEQVSDAQGVPPGARATHGSRRRMGLPERATRARNGRQSIAMATDIAPLRGETERQVGPPEYISARKADSGTPGGGGAGQILKKIQAWLSIRRQGVRRR